MNVVEQMLYFTNTPPQPFLESMAYKPIIQAALEYDSRQLLVGDLWYNRDGTETRPSPDTPGIRSAESDEKDPTWFSTNGT